MLDNVSMKPWKRDFVVNVLCRETHILSFRSKALVKEHDNQCKLRTQLGQVKPSDPPKYFLTFQGIRNNGLDGASYVRGNLEAMLNVSIRRPELSGCPTRSPSLTSVMLPSDVFIAIADKAQPPQRNEAPKGCHRKGFEFSVPAVSPMVNHRGWKTPSWDGEWPPNGWWMGWLVTEFNTLITLVQALQSSGIGSLPVLPGVWRPSPVQPHWLLKTHTLVQGDAP